MAGQGEEEKAVFGTGHSTEVAKPDS